MDKIFTLKQKIFLYIEYKGIKKEDFFNRTGISPSNFKGAGMKSELGGDKVVKILTIYDDLSPEWLLTGQGEMLKTNCSETQKTLDLPSGENVDSQDKYTNNLLINKEKRKLIPFYDTVAEAGTLQVSDMTPVIEPAEYIDAGDWFLDADSAMRVHGDSMFPEYKSGSIVVMREVFNKRLVVYGEDYVIQTSEYKVIKRLVESNREGYWTACSINTEKWEAGKLAGRLIHEPFDVFIDDITKLFRVLGCVKRTESSRIVYNQNKKI